MWNVLEFVEKHRTCDDEVAHVCDDIMNSIQLLLRTSVMLLKNKPKSEQPNTAQPAQSESARPEAEPSEMPRVVSEGDVAPNDVEFAVRGHGERGDIASFNGYASGQEDEDELDEDDETGDMLNHILRDLNGPGALDDGNEANLHQFLSAVLRRNGGIHAASRHVPTPVMFRPAPVATNVRDNVADILGINPQSPATRSPHARRQRINIPHAEPFHGAAQMADMMEHLQTVLTYV